MVAKATFGEILSREMRFENTEYVSFPWLSVGIPILHETRNLKIDAGF